MSEREAKGGTAEEGEKRGRRERARGTGRWRKKERERKRFKVTAGEKREYKRRREYTSDRYPVFINRNSI